MTVRNLTFSLCFFVATSTLYAQDGGAYRSFTPADQWELGLNAGLPFINGDIDAKFPGIGAGLHVRKSLDNVFSVRASVLYAQTKNEGGDNDTRKSEMSPWLSGSAQLVAAVNNMRFNKPYRKVLVNVFAGLGINQFTTNFENVPQASGASTNEYKSDLNAHVEVGAGLGFRISPRFNIGLEHQVITVFGRSADLLDSDQNVGRNVTTFRDFLHYPNLRLNFNIGKGKAEPAYWVNPLAQVSDAIAALEARPVYDPTDTDGDGVIDAIDQEINSPAGARVDSRGVTLDSDGDGVPDYKDKEPYSPPGFPVNADGVAQVPKPITEADVNRIVDAKIAQIKLPDVMGNWFLPSTNFNTGRSEIRTTEYEKLYQVATVMKNNPGIKIVVTGHTDATGSEANNNVLSYNRAKSAIDFLVSQHGISRDRLILNWAGESQKLVPATGSNSTNRRAEFRVAKGEKEMDPPAPATDGRKGNMQGNKDAGY